MQQRVAFWITGAFRTSLFEGVEAIADLIPIMLHLCKLNSRYHLCYASIPPSHSINLLLNSQHAKNQPFHRLPNSLQNNKLTSRVPSKMLINALTVLGTVLIPFTLFFLLVQG